MDEVPSTEWLAPSLSDEEAREHLLCIPPACPLISKTEPGKVLVIKGAGFQLSQHNVHHEGLQSPPGELVNNLIILGWSRTACHSAFGQEPRLVWVMRDQAWFGAVSGGAHC